MAQTLLENKELPEKIAQTINKVAEKKNRMSTELDETIQNIVKETAQDPIIDKLLEEIIGKYTCDYNNLQTFIIKPTKTNRFVINVCIFIYYY